MTEHTETGGLVATFDAGTTAIKGALVDREGRIVASASGDLGLIIDGDRREQDPDEWWRVFREVARGMIGAAGGRIRGVIMSGQMQDVIALDGNLDPVRNAILYSDGRASREAAALAERHEGGESRFLHTVGNRLEGCLPLPKLMWMRAHEPERFARTRHVLISSKDYLIARLAGVCVGDVAACSTAGAMDIRTGRWSAELCASAGLDAEAGRMLPELHNPQDRVGAVLPEAAALTGLPAGTPVYAGIGDAGATTFASGVTRPGQYNVNLGTSGWIATVSPEPFTGKPGAANLRFGVADGFVNAVPFLNAGDVHRWATGTLADGDYAAAHALLERSAPGAHGVLCLPYLVGERFPVMNPTVRGAYVGLSPDATRADLLRSALEGVALSIRQGMASFDAAPESISLIGGGARETVWCQILADVLDHPVRVFDHADILPAVALASLVFGRPELVEAASGGRTYEPDPAAARVYDGVFDRFLALYPALGGLR
ncbi:xylulokinase [Bifidobacterium avesanii]|uniref:Gluconate kinase n=1 Tax=Bifidobacterium avesanii TaxID=1798157 RepID=A0A7K3TFE9_9BIFI|nr:FGGY family carbohydrate kinase [Bifidobacterium avesanii]KAB8295408.1 gluconate kinase [Bifidobacterium avesanii]NEG77414.1 gluconate kinase [Bifidobacterium avesanii]